MSKSLERTLLKDKQVIGSKKQTFAKIADFYDPYKEKSGNNSTIFWTDWMQCEDV